MCTNGDELNLSIIAPAFNEAGCLPALVESLVQTLRPLEQHFEIILVDDASTDETAAVISRLCKSHPEKWGIHHRASTAARARRLYPAYKPLAGGYW